MSQSFAIEPVVAPWFDLETTDLEITGDLGFSPSNIVTAGQAFDVALSFQGDPGGFFWTGLKIGTNGVPFFANIDYFAQSMTGNPDVALGTRQIVLNVARDIYGPHGPATEDTRLNVTIPLAGVYKLSAQITFDLFPGVAGFYEGTPINVHV